VAAGAHAAAARMQTDTKQNPQIENGNAKPGYPPLASGVPNRELRISAGSPHLTTQQLQFLLRVTPPALHSQTEYEIPACITLAQAILESATAAGWGSSVLFRLANNPFGIKYEHFGTGEGKGDSRFKIQDSISGIPNAAPKTPDSESRIPNLKSGIPDAESRVPNSGPPNPNAESQITSTEPAVPAPEAYGAFDVQTWEIVNGQKRTILAQFQRFPNLDEAFTAHALLLRSPRYRPAFDVRHDWKQFAERLGPKSSPNDTEHCGYSTNPSYSAEIIKLVNLYLLNDARALQWYVKGMDPGPAVSDQLSATAGLVLTAKR